jgi:hypothetical protein
MTVFDIYPDCILTGRDVVRIINVAQPKKYPELYKAGLWRDPTHLNERGAIQFTKLIAEEVASLYGGDGFEKPSCQSL